jgi:hypothetical protein
LFSDPQRPGFHVPSSKKDRWTGLRRYTSLKWSGAEVVMDMSKEMQFAAEQLGELNE